MSEQEIGFRELKNLIKLYMRTEPIEFFCFVFASLIVSYLVISNL